MRGNWPLYPAMDVVVPHTRTIADLLEVLDVIVADDGKTRGDFWRRQPWVRLPKASEVRPESYLNLAPGETDADESSGEPELCLEGLRLGIPRMYINRDPDSNSPIRTRESVIALWERAREELEELGAEVVECDFPAVSNYEEDRPGAKSMYSRKIVPRGYVHTEMWDLAVWAWNSFLKQNGDREIRSLDDVDGDRIFPLPAGTIPDHYEDDPDLADLAEFARGKRFRLKDLPHVKKAVKGLEQVRRTDFEEWLKAENLDGLVFPTAADVAPFDADLNPQSNAIAWRNGVVYSNGNLVIRHLGIPTVTVPMGVMADIGMPVGLTFAGPAYGDTDLIRTAAVFERAHPARTRPPRTPALPVDTVRAGSTSTDRSDDHADEGDPSPAPTVELEVELSPMRDNGWVTLAITALVDPAGPVDTVEATVNGRSVGMAPAADSSIWIGAVELPAETHYVFHSEWRPPYGSLISVIARDREGRTGGAFTTAGGI